MKKYKLLLFLSLVAGCAYSQNKTFAVGTTSTNPNAVLQVDAPNANQGVLIPRLTTAQRSSLSSLTTTDVGLIVYDTDAKALAIWNGIAWDLGSKVGATALASGLAYPFKDSVTTNNGVLDLVAIKFNGTENKRVLRVENHNVNNTSSSISAYSKSNAGGLAVYGITEGTMSNAGAFESYNPANTRPSVYSYSNGMGGSGFFELDNPATTASALVAITNSNQPITAAIYGETTGTGDCAGCFRISNPASTRAAMYSETNGTGTAIQGINIGAGLGLAGLFLNTNVSNTYPALQASTRGTGPAIKAFQDATSQGSGMSVSMLNTSSTAFGMDVDQRGLGMAANFTINNSSNNSNGLGVQTNGTGPAIVGAQTNNGIGLQVNAGGLRVSTHTLGAPGPITTRATAYFIPSSEADGNYTLSFPLGEGDLFFVYSDKITSGHTFHGFNITGSGPGGSTFMFLGGAIRKIDID